MPEFDGVIFSDLHLSPDTKRLNELFEAFTDQVAGTPHVACLGDLTEYWIGYMQLRQPHGKFVFEQLKRLADGAKQALWVGGNRDFLLDPQARQAGYKTFRNVFEGEFAGTKVALEHGDRFCTLDKQYQRFRWWFRKIPWRVVQVFVSESRGHRMARSVRSKSKGETVRKQISMFGMQDKPVQRLVDRGARYVVAGHVHTPFAKPYGDSQLLVNSDWQDDGAIVCVAKDGEFSLMKFDGNRFKAFDAPTEQKVYTAT
ncbi:MAG: metallophosphoesterase [Planctomycetota bacterium]|jgi:UDP-2,3-diacylglucosamine hydrolase